MKQIEKALISEHYSNPCRQYSITIRQNDGSFCLLGALIFVVSK